MLYWLDCALLLAERLAAVGLFVLACYGTARIIQPATRPSVTEVLVAIDDHWKAVLLFLLPLFYSPIRAFLERVEEGFGMKAPRSQGSGQPGPGGPIPSGSPPTHETEST